MAFFSKRNPLDFEQGGALKGEHLCEEHQGNTSHYAKENCTICKLQKKLKDAKSVLEMINLRAQARHDTEMCELTFDAIKGINKS